MLNRYEVVVTFSDESTQKVLVNHKTRCEMVNNGKSIFHVIKIKNILSIYKCIYFFIFFYLDKCLSNVFSILQALKNILGFFGLNNDYCRGMTVPP